MGEYRRGDELWLEQLQPDDFASALNLDVLVPRPGGRFIFGRLLGRDAGKLHLLPLEAGARQQVVADPAWIAKAVRLVRTLYSRILQGSASMPTVGFARSFRDPLRL